MNGVRVDVTFERDQWVFADNVFVFMKCRCFHLHLLRKGFLIIGVLMAGVSVSAEDRIEVGQVRFSLQRAPGNTTEYWQEFAIELQARTGRENLGRVTDRLTVKAYLGYDHAVAGGKREWEFFRATAELVGLRNGRNVVRFYLPPEILKRDEVQGAPKYWAVELVGEGMEVAPTRRNYSAALNNESVLSQFMDQVAHAGAQNDGMLQPQHLTPFALEYPNATPTVLPSTNWR